MIFCLQFSHDTLPFSLFGVHKDIIEQWHEISDNVVCATNNGSDQPAHMFSLIREFASCLKLNILQTEHLEFPSLKGYCICSSESTIVKIPHCWKIKCHGSNDILPWDQSSPFVFLCFWSPWRFNWIHDMWFLTMWSVRSHMHSLIRAFASYLNILWLLSYRLNIWSFQA